MDIVVVFATLLFGLASLTILAAWTERQPPSGKAIAGVAASFAMIAIAHFGMQGGFSLKSVPLAFVDVAARIFN